MITPTDTPTDDAPPADGKAEAFAALMRVRAGPPVAPGEVEITGFDPFFRTPFRVAETVAAALAAIGVAVNDIWEARTGRRQRVSVDVRHAAASLQTQRYTQRRTAAGAYARIPVPDDVALQWALSVPWPTRDGRAFLPHFNLPHLQQRVLDVLACAPTKAAVAAAVAQRNALELEDSIAEARACGGTVRTAAEWRAHPQGRTLAQQPVVSITAPECARGIVTRSPPAFTSGPRPLSGVRVLDLTRILAGPMAGRVLAEHGADVLMVTAPHLPQTLENVRDTSHGKRSCFLDLRTTADRTTLRTLLEKADILIDGYRAGALDAFGLDNATLAREWPGLIHVSINCFGTTGPFAARGGWEQIAQAVTGICQTHGALAGTGQPSLFPVAMCDYLTGYLGAYGALLALSARSHDGLGRQVQASLCRSAMFIQDQGLLADWTDAPERLSEHELEALCIQSDTAYGALRTLGPVLQLSETPAHWALPSPALGSDRAAWA